MIADSARCGKISRRFPKQAKGHHMKQYKVGLVGIGAVGSVHVGVCVKHRTQDGQVVTCKTIEEICERLEAAGLTIVEGTH